MTGGPPPLTEEVRELDPRKWSDSLKAKSNAWAAEYTSSQLTKGRIEPVDNNSSKERINNMSPSAFYIFVLIGIGNPELRRPLGVETSRWTPQFNFQ